MVMKHWVYVFYEYIPRMAGKCVCCGLVCLSMCVSVQMCVGLGLSLSN